MAFLTRESFEYYDDQLNTIRQKKEELRKSIEEAETEEQQLLLCRRDYGIKHFGKTASREKIIKEAKETGYSSKAIKSLEQINSLQWDQDTITNEHIDEFYDAFEYVRNRKRYRDSWLYKLGRFFGDSSDEN